MRFYLPLFILLSLGLDGCITRQSEVHQTADKSEKQITSPLADTSTLEAAIRTLPPEAFAECSYEERQRILDDLRADPLGRFDPQKGWLNHFSDSGPVPPTSMIYLRLFRQADGAKIAFVHLPKPFADGSPPRTGQTFVLVPDTEGKWNDITAAVLPPEVDITGHFNPLRNREIVEWAPFVRETRQDGRGYCYVFGLCHTELHWNGHKFIAVDVPPRKLHGEVNSSSWQ